MDLREMGEAFRMSVPRHIQYPCREAANKNLISSNGEGVCVARVRSQSHQIVKVG